MFWKIRFFFLTMWYLEVAHFLLLNPRWMNLDRLGSKPLLIPHQVVSRKVGKFIRFFIFRKKNYCVLHAITLCKILRRYGVDVKLNITVHPHTYGVRNNDRGHSWLTLDDRCYFDTDPSTDMKKMELLEPKMKNIRYWVKTS